jgi:predicted naringenin-chalcone synthase
MSFSIRGLATARPEHSIRQPEAAEIARQFIAGEPEGLRGMPALFKRTRVRTRGSVLLEDGDRSGPRQSFFWPAASPEDRGPGTADRMQRYAQEAIPLALSAARGAFDGVGITPADVTHLVTVSCTGFFAPGVDIALIHELGLEATVGRLNVGFMGCHGALNGLRAAQAIAAMDPSAVVLLCAVELCSLHYQYGNDREQLVANAIFADGAAALLGQSAQVPAAGDWRLISCGSCLIPETDDAMTWRVGNHGFEMTLSPRVPSLIVRHLRPWLEEWLAQSGRTLGDIRSWAVHPGGPRILNSVAGALDLSPSATAVSRDVLAECGNMSSPTVLFVLDRLRAQAAPGPIVALAFGPGLVAESALFES